MFGTSTNLFVLATQKSRQFLRSHQMPQLLHFPLLSTITIGTGFSHFGHFTFFLARMNLGFNCRGARNGLDRAYRYIGVARDRNGLPQVRDVQIGWSTERHLDIAFAGAGPVECESREVRTSIDTD